MTIVQQRVILRGDNRRFFYCKDREAILAGPAESGKTFCGLLKIHNYLLQHPGAQIAILRKVFSDLKTSALITYRRDILKIGSFKEPHAYVTVAGGGSPEWFDYANDSRLWVAGLDNPGKTLSAERDAVYVVQAEQISLEDWEYLMRVTTGRGAIMPYTQLLGDCNPAGPTHWILTRDGLQLYHSTHRDNPTLYRADGTLTEQGERSMRDLSTLTGARYKRLFLGQWAAPEGVIYDVFDKDRHVCTGFHPPSAWPRIVGIDPFGDKVVALWLALEPAGNVWNVFREYVGDFGATTEGHVRAIIEAGENEPVFFYVGGGPSERQARADFAGYGVPLLQPAIADVWSQIDRVYSMLKSGQLVIHDSCPHLLSEIGEYRRKERGGQILEGTIDDKGSYHCLDALRYAMTGPEMPTQTERIVYRPR